MADQKKEILEVKSEFQKAADEVKKKAKEQLSALKVKERERLSEIKKKDRKVINRLKFVAGSVVLVDKSGKEFERLLPRMQERDREFALANRWAWDDSLKCDSAENVAKMSVIQPPPMKTVEAKPQGTAGKPA